MIDFLFLRRKRGIITVMTENFLPSYNSGMAASQTHRNLDFGCVYALYFNKHAVNDCQCGLYAAGLFNTFVLPDEPCFIVIYVFRNTLCCINDAVCFNIQPYIWPFLTGVSDVHY